MVKLKKTVGNWVDGDGFFDREADIAELEDRIREGTHTLLTAQRRMGKTSLVRELLRRMDGTAGYTGLFVNLEDASDPADAIVAISLQSRHLLPAWKRGKDWFTRSRPQVESVQIQEVRIKLRAAIDRGNWKQKGDLILKSLTKQNERMVLAIDEIPILVNRILKGRDYQITPERIKAADEFLSWLRRNAQSHRGRISMILSGSVGFAPILKQAGLSATMNIFSVYELQPWSASTASACFSALAANYELELPSDVQQAMCRRLRCCTPHHVQQYFDAVHRHLKIQGRQVVKLEDAEIAYREDMLGTRGRIDMDHYEERLKMVLGVDGYRVALALLARTALERSLCPVSIHNYERTLRVSGDRGAGAIPFVLEVLEHDGYLARRAGGFCFESGILEDWQRARLGLPFIPFAEN